MVIPFADQPYPWLSWLLAIVAVIITGIAKSGFGSGVGIVAVPMFVFAMGSREGLGTLLPILIAADILSAMHHRGTWDNRNLKLILPGSILGVVAGSFILGSVNTRGLEIGIGVICIVYLVLDFIKRKYAPLWHFKPDVVSGSATGFLSGIVSTLAHAAGPIVTIYLLGQHLNKSLFVGTAVLYFLLVNSIKLVPYGVLDMIDTTTLWSGLWLLPFVPVGTFLGVRLHRWMSEGTFRTTVMVILVISGVQLIIGKELLLNWLGL